MKARTRPAARLAALAPAAGMIALAAAPASAVAADDVDVVNTETVQVYMSADGEIQSRRVYEQLVLTGKGTVEIENPISEPGLRNLDGFSGFTVEGGEQRTTAEVDGVERLRTVSDYDGKLPLDIDVAYKLDGKTVQPGDVVGEEGRLEVEFTVTNVTGESREITLTNGRGGTVTKTAEVPLPMVGSLTTVAPENFTNVSSKQANMAGDGKGGTKLSFTMTLFPPIGSNSATFGYAADIEDGVVPRVDVTALPVNPLQSPSFKTAASSYQGGSETGTELAAGATEIDANLLKLRDGASDLLAGLLKLHAGSKELQAGLAGEAAPGAKKLADGAGQLNDGTGKALSGSKKLTDGLGKISGGLSRLSSAEGLPKASGGVDQLRAGVDRLLLKVGAVGKDGTLVDGLHRLESGLGALTDGLTKLRGDGSNATPGLVRAKGGVDQVQGGLHDAVKPDGSLDQLIGGLGILKTLDCGPICQGVINQQILPGVQASKTRLTAANAGLLQVSGGLGNAITALDTLLIPGAGKAKTGAGGAEAGAIRLRDEGLLLLKRGLANLDIGLTKAVAGVLELDAGAGDAHDGSGELADGLGRLDTGAGQLADGAGELADGLGEAADGSGKLADGLGQAAQGAPQLVDGAGRLSKEGTQVIAGKGAETAQNYGELYAVLEAGAERADTDKMAFGAPEGATGLTAYSFIITGEDGESGRNVARGVMGLGLLAAGGGVLALRRRLG